MKRICAWCQKDMGEIEPFEDKSITHGICPECKEQFFAGCPVKKFTQKDAEEAADGLGIMADDFPSLLVGMQHELLEHCDITDGDPLMTARIALAHLKERRDYYQKLKECEL